ncbi:unnamed protein product [Pleuronectes platessa]|uniref:Uncharacterized protein n=1 Tax=Pleuronectes platessa TaxID=8262 RepID=A0A9N7UVD5_PLEPL|nr:unnamed protein product [Pleuronectes platessa]
MQGRVQGSVFDASCQLRHALEILSCPTLPCNSPARCSVFAGERRAREFTLSQVCGDRGNASALVKYLSVPGAALSLFQQPWGRPRVSTAAAVLRSSYRHMEPLGRRRTTSAVLETEAAHRTECLSPPCVCVPQENIYTLKRCRNNSSSRLSNQRMPAKFRSSMDRGWQQ